MASKREQLVGTALGLFCKQGFKATGIDQILKEAGVAKMTLYQHFPSKEALIAECLRVLDGRNVAWYANAVRELSKDPKVRLREVFAPMRHILADTAFSGCPFVRAAGEYADANDPIYAAAAEHKEKFRLLFEEFAREAGVKQPEVLSRQMQMLFEGAMAMHQFTGAPDLPALVASTWRELLGSISAS